MKMEMEMDTAFGVVPSQDDLQWIWEDQDGAHLEDLLLSSTLPSPQKPSVGFVEAAYGNVVNNSGYEQQHKDMNEWYNKSMDYEKNYYKKQSQNVQKTSYNSKYGNYYQPEYCTEQTATEEPVTPTTNAIILETLQAQHQLPVLPANEVNAYLNSTEVSPTGNYSNANQFNGYRTAVSSVYSNSSWESYTEDSSHATELSQEEIFEEIQRECAEFERSSSSPKLQKSTRTIKKTSRANRKFNAEERKKELNRAAAAKYREKRRLLKENTQEELELLETRNRKLQSQANSLENEINYLKDLIKEIRTR